MIVNKLELKQALNSKYLKVKPDTENIQSFKDNLGRMLALCDSKKDEEFNKNLLSDFFKKSLYGDRYFINTKENSDLVIHNDKEADSTVGVIFETKKPTKTNSVEMPRVDHLNRKAFQQLVLYFLRERVTHGNVAVKHLVVTNVYEWFIFDAKIFEELFFSDKQLVKNFQDFGEGRLSGTTTDFFYKQIAEPAIAKVIDRIKFTHFDLRDLENLDLIDLYKVLSPEHLLKLPFANDSNSLNKPFYNELLYIIGLTEEKVKGKKLIDRRAEGDRHDGSLIENAISRLDSLDKISQLKKPEEFGESYEERLFNVALRLSINWINRILFLKLLEAQLIKYHQGDPNSARDFAFLNLAKVQNYDDLDSLFFDVLAREQDKREAKVKAAFANVPYLNSSLFEPTETEQETIVISNLKDLDLPIFSGTVLKDEKGNKRSGSLNALAYLFEFLGAYRFDRDELEDTQEDSEKLINASVLGLIFEKINGYRDGSFYTPSFITMYMCRETIRRAVVQKFNEVKGWDCETIQDLYERIDDKKEANVIINSLKICDPAVGSGHFLVSALNEMIAIKSELRVLLDRTGKSLRDYYVKVQNDKLVVRDDEENLFVYKPKNYERQRVQEALFHEKQTIIESCLFGVDINPNSVTICRLRLWIELLKNAYYRVDGNLETLPNIDINIKCGNSLISRFGLDVDVKQVLKKQKFSIEQYRNAVQTYRSAESKAQKREMEGLIAKIKDGFSSSLSGGDPKKVKLRQLQAELYSVENQTLLFEETKAEVKAREKKVNKLNNEIDKLTAEIEDIESGRLYENALEWRFEFPEVLNNDGDFVGFDSIIGNPPYIRQEEIKELKPTLQQNYQCYTGVADLFVYFYELGLNLLKAKGHLTFICSNKYFRAGYGEKLRQFLTDSSIIHNLIDFGDYPVFEEAIAYPSIITLSKAKSENNQVKALAWDDTKKQDIAQFATVLESNGLTISQSELQADGWRLESAEVLALLAKLRSAGKPLGEYVNNKIYMGVKTGLNEVFVISKKQRDDFIAEDPASVEIIKPFLRGKDVKRWSVDFAEQYIIFAKRGFSIDRYPAIRKYLEQYRIALSSRATINTHPWYELQQPQEGIYQEFEQPKIIYPDIYEHQSFAIDNLGFYSGNTCYFIPTDETWLCGLLNSQLIEWFYTMITNSIRGGYLRAFSDYMKQIPIVNTTKPQRTAIEKLVQKCLDAKKGDPKADTSELEKAIDALVYQLYGLTEEEIKIVEGER